MFYLNSNGIITLSRGDSAEAPLFLNQGTKICPIRYKLQGNDIVYLGVTEPNQKFEDAIIRKVYTKDNLNDLGDVVVKLEPSDTVNLIPGKYYYEVKLSYYDNDGNNYINTVIKKTEFNLED